ncbi:MAG: serine hydrolase domain-containing protein [Flavobacteriales bacterium]
MKYFSKYLLFAAVTFLLSNCSREVEQTINLNCEHPLINQNHPRATTYQNFINDYVKKGLPGISLLIEDEDGIFVGAAGKADLENNIDFTPCHISKAASITKLLVGTLTLKLQEDGKLSLDDPIEKYIDQNTIDRIDGASGKKIRQLMNHTTGIFDVITSSKFYLAVLNNPNKAWTQEELLRFVYGETAEGLNNPYPANYSNTNTLLLSMCIDKATGESHAKLLRSKILEPLQMGNTFYQSRESIPNTAAQGYYDLYNNNRVVNVSNLITGSGNGYGGIYSNVFDLHRFIKALFAEKTILNEASLAEMFNTTQEDDDFFTGAGTVKKFTQKAAYGIGHTGRDLGYSANLFYFPERNVVITFFVNYGTNGDSRLRPIFRTFESELTDLVLQ